MTTNTDGDKTFWAIVPAAGLGKRMQSSIPKQYLLIDNRPVLQLTIERLLSAPMITGVVVALHKDDDHWDGIEIGSEKPVIRADGGKERCDSVINALTVLQQQDGFDAETSWVLVHDAVRPCISVADIEKLIFESTTTDSGGLLATPVRDTMKRQDESGAVSKTVDREGLWHALTPQCFPFKSLLECLVQAENSGFSVTDESSAMEQAGYTPKLVQGSDKNIKITRPEDLEMAQHNFSLEE